MANAKTKSELPKTSYYKKQFLKLYSKTGRFYDSASKAGVSHNTVYLWLEKDAAFAKLFEDAKAQYLEIMEAEADRRGKTGVNKPVYQGGDLVGHVREYSDTMLIFRLKALDPRKYRERIDTDITSKGKEIKAAPVFQIVDQETKDLLLRIQNGERANPVEADKDIQGQQPGVPEPPNPPVS